MVYFGFVHDEEVTGVVGVAFGVGVAVFSGVGGMLKMVGDTVIEIEGIGDAEIPGETVGEGAPVDGLATQFSINCNKSCRS